ncbi:GNAT family N-acetyltransferase [Metabacillus sp. 84]|uniref:GNAT family N-acetyltransferase n=1 Tax=Metabacillus sp. 84 TaxID=3404705 RepID=UPI003CEDDBA9
MERVGELIGESEWIKGYPIIKQLRPHLDEITFIDLVALAAREENYRVKLMYSGLEPVAYIGFQPMITLYYGKYIWVSDLAADQNHRSRGFGKRLLEHVEYEAKDNGYEGIALSSNLQRTAAHRFYEEKMGYERSGYTFKKGF